MRDSNPVANVAEMNPIEAVRGQLRSVLFDMIAGEEGPSRQLRIHGAVGPRRFSEIDPIWHIHSDASMFVGGIRALLLQSLHPLAMAAVDQHSGFRGDPWGRLHRTSTFIAETTFGTTADADRAIAIVRAVHKRVTGVADDGRPYAASDPDLLRWIHIAEIDSFLRAHDLYGRAKFSDSERDAYVAQAGIIASQLGASEVPTTVAELDEALAAFRPELRATPAAHATVRFLLLHPPIGVGQRLPYASLSAAAVNLMPDWARTELRLPRVPMFETPFARINGVAMTVALRWLLVPARTAAPKETEASEQPAE